jgi:hypothetical protein
LKKCLLLLKAGEYRRKCFSISPSCACWRNVGLLDEVHALANVIEMDLGENILQNLHFDVGARIAQLV